MRSVASFDLLLHHSFLGSINMILLPQLILGESTTACVLDFAVKV